MEGGGSNAPFYRGSTAALATNPSAAVFLFLAFSRLKGKAPLRRVFWCSSAWIRNIAVFLDHLLLLCRMALRRCLSHPSRGIQETVNRELTVEPFIYVK